MCSTPCFGRFIPGNRPGLHCTGSWMGSRTGLNKCGKSRPNWYSIPDRPACSEWLYRLSYTGCWLWWVITKEKTWRDFMLPSRSQWDGRRCQGETLMYYVVTQTADVIWSPTINIWSRGFQVHDLCNFHYSWYDFRGSVPGRQARNWLPLCRHKPNMTYFDCSMVPADYMLDSVHRHTASNQESVCNLR